MGVLIDLAKILAKTGDAKVLSGGDAAIQEGLRKAAATRFEAKYGKPMPSDTVTVGQLNGLNKNIETAKKVKSEEQVPLPPPAPEPAPTKAQVVVHPSVNEEVVAPSSIPERQVQIDSDESKLAQYHLAESAYMHGSMEYSEYLTKIKKLFPEPK